MCSIHWSLFVNSDTLASLMTQYFLGGVAQLQDPEAMYKSS
jgi:hypothetical protein